MTTIPLTTLPRSVPLLDVNRDNGPLRDEMLAAAARVIDTGRFLHGPEVKEFEVAVAAVCGVRHAIGCASGSDALLLALLALDIGPGDEVVVPSFTFFATASAVTRVGARPVFADIEPATFNLAPAALERAMTARTKAVIPVHLFGQCAATEEIVDIARPRGIHIIEDAAQAIGAKRNGRAAGSVGTIGCLSFYPSKNLGGCGDGGMLTTNDDRLAERLRLFAAHGMSPRYYHRVIGINSRLDTLQAALLLVKHQALASWTAQRQANATRYHALFRQTGLDGAVGLPQAMPGNDHVWNQFTIRVAHGRRDALREHLTRRNIGSEIYYPLPLHLQDCFRELRDRTAALPETERAAAEVMSLPIFPGLRADEQQLVVAAIADFFAAQQSRAA